MKEVINQQTIIDLKRSRNNIIGSIIISLVVAIGGCVPLFLLASREYKHIFAILLALICTVEASFILYMVVVCLIPANNYMKLCRLSFTSTKYSTKGKIISVNQKVTHYRGVAVREIKVLDLDENKELIFYVEQYVSHSFLLNEEYIFVTYQSVITSYEII